MRITDKEIKCKGRSDTFRLYAIGDTHVGKRNCAEDHIRRLVRKIAADDRAMWVGGGDYVDAIKLQDKKRFDPSSLPDWILEGDASTTRDRLKDVVRQSRERFLLMVRPIADKCLGLIEGNHEFEVKKQYGEDLHGYLCEGLGVPDLTDAAFLRLRFVRRQAVVTIIVFVCHGHGGGRSRGAEPNHLGRLAEDKDADVVLRGHSHTFCIASPLATMYVPRSGQIPEECSEHRTRMGNWGAWIRSYAAGPSTYDSRACYPARSLSTLEIEFAPHLHGDEAKRISMRELVV